MAVVRHGTGPRAALRAFASQVHPVFMLPPLAASAFGGILAGRFEPVGGGLHLLAIFLAVYTAHLKDGYVDYHGRGEDEDHPLTAGGCRLALLGSSVAFALALLGLWLRAPMLAVVLTVPTWIIAFLHAPHLDTRAVSATVGYPMGVALAVLGGVAANGGSIDSPAVGFAAVLLVLLSGVKVIDDAADHDYDRSIGKRTVAVSVGQRRARTVANTLIWLALVAVVVLSVSGAFPPSTPLAAAAFGGVWWLARRAPPAIATPLLVRGAYVFLALVVAAVWFEPLHAMALPDIAVLGRFTYLATELAFGAVAAGLIWRAGAWWPAARTIGVVYPLAYVWDWYTLEVGVFEIPLRTGVMFADIPIEEHLFMIVVPALVIGVHESLRDTDPS